VEEEDPRCHRIMKEEDLCHGGSTAWRRRTHTAAAPWRSRTCAVEEEEPTTMVPRHRRGSRGRRDAGTRGRHALKELQQQRPLESYRRDVGARGRDFYSAAREREKRNQRTQQHEYLLRAMFLASRLDF
jgi:hypothetical protein